MTNGVNVGCLVAPSVVSRPLYPKELYFSPLQSQYLLLLWNTMVIRPCQTEDDGGSSMGCLTPICVTLVLLTYRTNKCICVAVGIRVLLLCSFYMLQENISTHTNSAV